MFIGPIFTRELITQPRRPRHFVARGTYIVLLFILMTTVWQSVVGWQSVSNVGGLAQYGYLLFQILSYLQLSFVAFFTPIYAASSVCAERDRKTMELLLMTDLASHEIVLGKLFASMLQILMLILAGLPVFALTVWLGGVGFDQIFLGAGVTLVTGIAAGSFGSLMAFWREKTFQVLALTMLGVVFIVISIEALAGDQWAGLLNPFRAMFVVVNPLGDHATNIFGIFPNGAVAYTAIALAAAVVLNVAAIVGVRVWNPRQVTRVPTAAELEGDEGKDTTTSDEPYRAVNEANPVFWRETKTRPYGRRPIVIKLAYVVLFALVCVFLYGHWETTGTIERMTVAKALLPVFILTLFLVNAQASISITAERDQRTLDILLVTDITPKEFIYGKLGGILLNTAVMIVLPLVLTVALYFMDAVSFQVLVFLLVDEVILILFAAVLGLHSCFTYETTRGVLANSLGTIFFLFVGIFICIYLILIGDQFAPQLASFMVFIFAGSIALYASLGAKNPSAAITLVAVTCPFFTFYSLVSFFLGAKIAPFLVSTSVYGFAILALLIPAISEFDVALGRTVETN